MEITGESLSKWAGGACDRTDRIWDDFRFKTCIEHMVDISCLLIYWFGVSLGLIKLTA